MGGDRVLEHVYRFGEARRPSGDDPGLVQQVGAGRWVVDEAEGSLVRIGRGRRGAEAGGAITSAAETPPPPSAQVVRILRVGFRVDRLSVVLGDYVGDLGAFVGERSLEVGGTAMWRALRSRRVRLS